MTLNSVTPETFFINLLKRPDRFDHFTKQIKNLEIYSLGAVAVDGSTIPNPTGLRNGEYALLLSYEKVIKYAKLQNFEAITVFEDDALFDPDFNNRFAAEFPEIPNDWDLVFLGENSCSLGAGWIPPENISDNIRRIYSSFGAHAIMIKNHMYDHILEGISRFDKPLDVMYCDLQQRFKAYGFRRPLVKQASFTSDIIGFNPMYLEQGVFD